VIVVSMDSFHAQRRFRTQNVPGINEVEPAYGGDRHGIRHPSPPSLFSRRSGTLSGASLPRPADAFHTMFRLCDKLKLGMAAMRLGSTVNTELPIQEDQEDLSYMYANGHRPTLATPILPPRSIYESSFLFVCYLCLGDLSIIESTMASKAPGTTEDGFSPSSSGTKARTAQSTSSRLTHAHRHSRLPQSKTLSR